MPKVLKIKKHLGQKARILLLEKNWLDKDRIIGRTQRYLLFPLIEAAEHHKLLKLFKDATIENRNLEPLKKKIAGFEEAVEKVIPQKYLKLIKHSFDIIGDIAVVELPKEFENLERTYGWTLQRTHPYIKVVAKKAGPTKGVHRVRKIKVISGENRTETVHTEHGVKMLVDLNKVYFSPRLSGERGRIAGLVKPFERVLVLFAGVAPFPLVIAKAIPTVTIWAIELNPSAFRLMKKNIKLNRFEKRIIPIKGDVRKEAPKLKIKFDRIIMMLPTGAKDYLDVALKVAAKGAIIHIYAFGQEDDLKKIDKEIIETAKKRKYRVRILKHIRAGTYAPHIFRWCIELKVL